MSKIAIFGGTFNPVHNGHVNLISSINKEISIDNIIIIPTNIPPHKKAEDLASANDRLNMCRLAFENMADVSEYEINRPGKSFTIDTLKHFKSKYPDDELYLIMGSDMLLSITTWKSYKEILSFATIIAASRSHEDTARITEYAEVLRDDNAKIITVLFPPYEISSTRIREMIADNEDYTCYLPQKVVEYIRNFKLYK